MDTVTKEKTERRYKAAKEHLFCELDGKSVILSLKSENYYGINAVGTSIWSAIQSPRTLAEIEARLLNEFEVEEDVCRREVSEFLEKMAKQGLIEVIDEAAG